MNCPASEFGPLLFKALELSLGLFGRTSMQLELDSVLLNTITFLLKLVWVHLGQGLYRLF